MLGSYPLFVFHSLPRPLTFCFCIRAPLPVSVASARVRSLVFVSPYLLLYIGLLFPIHVAVVADEQRKQEEKRHATAHAPLFSIPASGCVLVCVCVRLTLSPFFFASSSPVFSVSPRRCLGASPCLSFPPLSLACFCGRPSRPFATS